MENVLTPWITHRDGRKVYSVAGPVQGALDVGNPGYRVEIASGHNHDSRNLQTEENQFGR